MKRIIYILLFLLSAPHVYSQKILEVQQEFKQDTARIESHVRNSFLANTADFVQCMYYLFDEYDKLLNKYYRLLMSTLDEEGKAALKSAQVNWIKYQTADRKLLDNISMQIYKNMEGGTMSNYLSAPLYGYMVKDRAIELYNYYSAIVESKYE